ncbi:MAG: putative multidrug ABC transporter permease YbhR [Anaerolineae bacterium]|nr:putative multidrug ABC transporter permease YbhR [Anaerolineae bacterium]
MFRRTFSLIRKELTHIVRDPRTLAIMIVLPLIMLVVLGYAATTDIKHLRTAVYDADKTPQSRKLIEAYQASNYFDIVAYVQNERDLTYLIDHDDVRSALVIPPGYGRDRLAGERTEVAFIIDGSDPGVANTVFGASQQVGQAVSIRAIEQNLGVAVSRMPGVEVRPRVWYNPNLESSHFMIPGIIVIVLFLFTTLFTSTSIVRERELGTIEQLIVTPIRPIELVVAKVLPYVLVSFFVVIEVLTLGVLIFGVPINGSLTLLLGLCSLFLVTALGIGIFISSLAKTQTEAFLMTFATIMPTIFLSGFYFPIEAMPRVLQLISYIIPAKYGLIIVRSIILKGVGIEILREQIVAILIFAAIIVTLAATRFKKKLE